MKIKASSNRFILDRIDNIFELLDELNPELTNLYNSTSGIVKAKANEALSHCDDIYTIIDEIADSYSE